ARRLAGSATARVGPDGGHTVRIAAADIVTGARTALTQIAADALEVPVEQVHVLLGGSELPFASVARGSSGTASWGTAVVRACEALGRAVAEHGGTVPREGLEATVDTTEEIEEQEPLSRHAYGAQF